MRLSDAILLGDSLKKADSSTYLEKLDGEIVGCALGGALLAYGVKLDDSEYASRKHIIFDAWPWISQSEISAISIMYSMLVRSGEGSIEEIAAYVRSIEPNDEPVLEEKEWTDSDTRREQLQDQGVRQ